LIGVTGKKMPTLNLETSLYCPWFPEDTMTAMDKKLFANLLRFDPSKCKLPKLQQNITLAFPTKK
jgi:hypothetical protein